MDKVKNIALNDDGELTFDSVEATNRKSGCIKAFLFILYTFIVIGITVFVTALSVEPIEDWWLDLTCERTLVVDVLSNPATLRSRPFRSASVVGYANAGPRHIILGTKYYKGSNDCWVKIEVDGTTGWILTLIDK